jgi:ornithine cyclodeaminase/alanine dehydrogenase
VETPEQAAESDAVVCVTTARDKFLRDDWIRPGMTVLALGSYQECEDELILKADKIIVDHVEQCLHRGALRDVHAAGRLTERNLHATIGEIVAGKKPGRTSPTERILCVPLGTGAMDIAVATMAYRRALERGLGQRFAFA